MGKKELQIYTVFLFHSSILLSEGYQKMDTTGSKWNRATDFVRDYPSGHSSYGKRATEVNVPYNSNKMFEKQFDSFLPCIDVPFIFIVDCKKI